MTTTQNFQLQLHDDSFVNKKWVPYEKGIQDKQDIQHYSNPFQVRDARFSSLSFFVALLLIFSVYVLVDQTCSNLIRESELELSATNFKIKKVCSPIVNVWPSTMQPGLSLPVNNQQSLAKEIKTNQQLQQYSRTTSPGEIEIFFSLRLFICKPILGRYLNDHPSWPLGFLEYSIQPISKFNLDLMKTKNDCFTLQKERHIINTSNYLSFEKRETKHK